MSTRGDGKRNARVFAALIVDGHDLGLVRVRDASSTTAFVEHPSPILPLDTQIKLRVAGSVGCMVQATVREIQRSAESRASGYVVDLVDPPPDFMNTVAGYEQTTDDLNSGSLAIDSAGGSQALVVAYLESLAGTLSGMLSAERVPVARASNIERAKELVDSDRDTLRVVLIDLAVPRVLTDRLIDRIRSSIPRAHIIVLAAGVPPESVRRGLVESGADQLLLETVPIPEIGAAMVRAARTVKKRPKKRRASAI